MWKINDYVQRWYLTPDSNGLERMSNLSLNNLVGSHSTTACSSGKAMQSRTMFFFSAWLLNKLLPRFPAESAEAAKGLLKSAECLKQFYCIVKENGPHVPVRECKRAIVAVKKHVVLWSEHSGMNATPKRHALYELARGIECAGNPNIYSTYMDE